MEEVTGPCKKLHNRELHNLYPSLHIIKTIITMRVTWGGLREMRNAYKMLSGKSGRPDCTCQGNRSYEQQSMRMWTRLMWFGIRHSDGIL
jgi:hypothetical protein